MQKNTKSKFVSKGMIFTLCILAIAAGAVFLTNYYDLVFVRGDQYKQKMKDMEQKLSAMQQDLQSAAHANPNAQMVDEIQIKAAYALTKTAATSLQHGQDIETAKTLLQLAYDHLAPLNGAKVEQAKRILAADQAKLNAISIPDKRKLQEQLTTLDKLINILPLHGSVVEPVENNAPVVKNKDTKQKAWYQPVSAVVKDIKNVVKVRKKDSQTVQVSDIDIARAQFKLLIEQIRWAAFYNNAEVYMLSVQNAQTLLPQVFDMQSESVQKFAATLQELHKVKLYTDIPNIENSVNALQAILVR